MHSTSFCPRHGPGIAVRADLVDKIAAEHRRRRSGRDDAAGALACLMALQQLGDRLAFLLASARARFSPAGSRPRRTSDRTFPAIFLASARLTAPVGPIV